MYAVAERLDPDSYRALARAVFAEMALAGITCVGEFHYLHHGAAAPYADPNAMGEALIAAAAEAGIRITLLDTCYLAGGFGDAARGRPASASPTATRTPGRSAPRRCAARRTRASAPRSTPCARCPPTSSRPSRTGRASAARRCTRTCPSSAPRTRPASPPTAARRPSCSTSTARSARGCLHGPRHPPHRRRRRAPRRHGGLHVPDHRARPRRRHRPGRARSPTPARRCASGSDSHAVIDLFEEARAVELDERLRTERRGHFTAAELLRAATNHAALGWPEAGRIEPGAPADLVTVSLDSVRLAGAEPDTLLETAVFAASAADVREVRRRRPPRRRRGPPRDARRRRRAARRDRADPAVRAMSVLIDNIGTLVTNDPELGAGPLGLIEDAALVLGDGVVAVGGPARRDARGRRATSASTPAAARSSPASSTPTRHLVFAGDRAREFAARMAGERYEAGGIRTTVAATRARHARPSSTRTTARLVAEARRSGTTTIECKSGYGLTVEDEARSLAVAGRHTDEVTYLGAHVVAARVRRRPGRLRRARRPARCSTPARRTPAGSTSSASAARSTATRRARSSRPASARGLTPRVHANQLGHGPGVQLAVELGAASADHVTHVTDADVDALASGDTVATLLPGAEFSTRARLPRRAPAARRGRHRRARRRLQPRHELHDEHPVLHRARRARDGHDARRGGLGGDRRRRPRAAPRRRRPPRRRRARRRRAARRPEPPPPRLPAGRAARRRRLAAGRRARDRAADRHRRRPRPARARARGHARRSCARPRSSG